MLNRTAFLSAAQICIFPALMYICGRRVQAGRAQSQSIPKPTAFGLFEVKSYVLHALSGLQVSQAREKYGNLRAKEKSHPPFDVLNRAFSK